MKGRKSKLYIVLQNIEKIKEWKRTGVADTAICEQLKISKPAYYKYIKENPELRKALKESVNVFVGDLRSELARQALKHEIKTTKQYVKKDLVTGNLTEFTETTIKEVDGNLGAIHLLLKNLDKENWSENWQTYELKKQELELKKESIENANF